MSASNSRVRDSIRRIALSDPDIRALLEDYKNRGGIASDSIEIEGAADDRAICCDGSTSSGTPGSSTRDADADGSGQDASDGLGDDPASLDMGGGSLIGVKDCATGEPICFEGSDWIPPEGWDDPAEPPTDPEYQEGYAWAEGGVIGQTPTATLYALGNEVVECVYECVGWTTVEDDLYITSADGSDGCTGTVDGQQVTCQGTTSFSRVDCSDTPDDPACTAPPPLLGAWPADGCINLATKGGKLVASKYDPEAQGTDYLKGTGEIELCDDYGNSFSLSASGSVEGGWKTIDSTNEDGYLYDATGTQIARISGSEYSDPAI